MHVFIDAFILLTYFLIHLFIYIFIYSFIYFDIYPFIHLFSTQPIIQSINLNFHNLYCYYSFPC